MKYAPIQSYKRKLLSHVATLSLIGLAGGFAQNTYAQVRPDDEIVVTGTRIKQKNLVASSPVTSINAEDIATRGVARIEDLVNELPQVFASQGSNIGNGATGIATVNLRGLDDFNNSGSSRTLVLIDGHRMAPGTVKQTAADLNQIPAALVKNVDILTGGAGAVYGSDALAGVVNFQMERNFEGIRLDVQIGAYQHNNNNKAIQNVLSSSGNLIAPMQQNQLDGAVKDFTLVFGSNFNGDKGNLTGYVGYRNAKEITQESRDYSGCAFGGGTAVGPFTCVGSFTTPLGTFGDATLGQFLTTLDTTTGNTFRNITFANGPTFNFNPTNHFQRPDNRYTAGVFAHYDVTPKDEMYLDFMYADDRSVAQIAFSGNFGNTTSVSCDNPFLSAQQRNQICTSRGFGPTAVADLTILRRNVEGGPRQDDLRHTSYRGLLGMRGDFRLLDGFEYDLSAQLHTVHMAENYVNELSIARMQNALLATTGPNGNSICRPDLVSDPNCVPINWFEVGGVTQAALNYVSGRGFQDGNYEQVVILGTVSGDLGAYGFKLPGTEEGAKVVFGGEYREDDFELRVDQAFSSGDLSGQGGPTNGLTGSYDSWEGFGELELPLLEDQPFAQELTFKGAYRYADNEISGATNSYSAGGIWQMNDYLRLRGQYQRAVRVPNAIELFTPAAIGLFPFAAQDPCSGATPRATLAQCQNSGVTAAQYGNIAPNPAQQYNALFGGNSALDPEKSDTFTIGGVVRAPGALDGVLLSVDYFDIKVKDFIGTVVPSQAVNRCVQNAEPFMCALINRDPASGSLWLNPNGFVTATNLNTGSLQTSGIDASLEYNTDLPGNWGGLDTRITGTYLIDLLTESLPGDTPFECVGFYSGQCTTPSPAWRHIASVNWKTVWDTDVKLTWRHFSNVKAESQVGAVQGSNDAELGAQDYFDLAVAYRGIDGVTLRAGVNNLLDRDPPLTSSGGGFSGNGNTFPQVYDSLGRYLFARATIDF